MRMASAAVWTIALSGLLRVLPADAEELKFLGYAYDLKTGKYLYTEAYDEEVGDHRWLRGRTRYFSPEGKQIGEKKIDFSTDPYVPVYSLDLPDIGYGDGIDKVSADGIELFKQTREKGRQTRTIAKAPVMVADAGFHAYIVANMDGLLAGKSFPFRFAVAGQLDAYNFRVRKVGDTQFEGKPAVRLEIELDSLLRFAVDPLILTYDPVTRRLLEYRGVSNLIDPVTDKAYNVRIVYPSRPPDDAPKNLPSLD